MILYHLKESGKAATWFKMHSPDGEDSGLTLVCDTVGVHDLGSAQLVLRRVHLLAEQLVEGCRGDVLVADEGS
jgi:hypothetical protein